MSNYTNQLKDPRWQKKRLLVMKRDKFMCALCKSNVKTLNVHHKHYEQGKKPWEYEIDSLITLCEDCHKQDHQDKKELGMIAKFITEVNNV